jgi:hypothetical protein
MSGEGEAGAYELLDASGNVLLVADQTEGALPDERRQLRLTGPGGRLVATIDLPQPSAEGQSDVQEIDYALIHNFAVYAILSQRRRPGNNHSADGTYFILEVEGETWLALPDPDANGCYALFDEVPVGLHTYEAVSDLDLPSAVGHICYSNNGHEHDWRADIAPNRLQETGLLVLALAFLIDRTSHSG